MELEAIKDDINLSIQNINKILSQEDFSAYHKIKDLLKKSIAYLDASNETEAKKQLALSIRFLMEAPPKDKNLGLNTLKELDKTFKKLSALID